MSKTIWWYLVEDKNTHERFVMYGDLRTPSFGVTNLIALTSSGRKTPYGNRCDKTTDIKYNTKYHRIIHQTFIRKVGK